MLRLQELPALQAEVASPVDGQVGGLQPGGVEGPLSRVVDHDFVHSQDRDGHAVLQVVLLQGDGNFLQLVAVTGSIAEELLGAKAIVL